MPFTLDLAQSPYGIALSTAYAVITNIAAMCSLNNGAAAEPSVTLYVAIYASEAAYQSGAQPVLTETFAVTAATPIMPALETALKPLLAAMAGVTGVTAVEA